MTACMILQARMLPSRITRRSLCAITSFEARREINLPPYFFRRATDLIFTRVLSFRRKCQTSFIYRRTAAGFMARASQTSRRGLPPRARLRRAFASRRVRLRVYFVKWRSLQLPRSSEAMAR